jgi:hypothetical protein
MANREGTTRNIKKLKEYVDTKTANNLFANGESMKDDASNELIKFTKVSSAVNEVNVSNNSAGNDPIIAVTGNDTNIGLVINQKAAAPITLGTTSCTGVKLGVDQPIMDSSGNEQIKFVKTSSAVNEITVTNAATGNAPSIKSTGETNVGLTLAGKGTGAVAIGQATSVGVDLVADQPIRDSVGNELIKFVKTTDAVNEVTITNNATGSAPSVTATGGDTNIEISVAGKGTGSVNLGQATSTGVKLVADQALLDSSGNELVKFTKAATAVNEVTIANAATGGAPSISATGETNVDLTLASKGTGHINAPLFNPTFGVSAHDYGAAAVAWTLSAAEMQDIIVTASNANGAVDAIATPTAGKIYIVANSTGQALTFKASGQTGVTIASTKTAIVRGNGTDFVRVTADA